MFLKPELLKMHGKIYTCGSEASWHHPISFPNLLIGHPWKPYYQDEFYRHYYRHLPNFRIEEWSQTRLTSFWTARRATPSILSETDRSLDGVIILTNEFSDFSKWSEGIWNRLPVITFRRFVKARHAGPIHQVCWSVPRDGTPWINVYRRTIDRIAQTMVWKRRLEEFTRAMNLSTSVCPCLSPVFLPIYA